MLTSCAEIVAAPRAPSPGAAQLSADLAATGNAPRADHGAHVLSQSVAVAPSRKLNWQPMPGSGSAAVEIAVISNARVAVRV